MGRVSEEHSWRERELSTSTHLSLLLPDHRSSVTRHLMFSLSRLYPPVLTLEVIRNSILPQAALFLVTGTRKVIQMTRLKHRMCYLTKEYKLLQKPPENNLAL